KAVYGERAHPAVDVGTARAVGGEAGGEQQDDEADGEDGDGGRLVFRVAAGEVGVQEAVLGHAEQDAGGGGDACEGAGEHADEGGDVDERPEGWEAGEGAEGAEGGLGLAEVLVELAEAKG